MWRYLKEAFLVRPNVPGLGHFPANVLAVVCFAILGIAHPGFWLLGLGLEAGFLTLLATNRRFQRVVDGTDLLAANARGESERLRQVDRLAREARARHDRLAGRCDRAAALYREIEGEDLAVQANVDALERLRAVHLRLLLAQSYLTSPETHANESSLRQQAAALRRELEHAKLPPQLRESKSATLVILERRLANLEDRDRSLAEIESDLNRIEAQVDLAVENAALRGKPAAISANVGLVSQLLDDSLFGGHTVAGANGDVVYPTAAQGGERA
ncbi:MAG: hypothetical protein AVDCRST_MAG64-1856 [uncultured Phycisphaerae bacterium]|uniref:Uncharacterized protein n=1 Tax=uncultured Phycisphaerae bacterium TaxID=904963 RepID=A0A6J4P5K8_9BACT|nr:MAG: hypothetical protein AVDCRST_MAG64-1856 [uncultured Phycisphaerae bacterium]